MKRRYTLSRTTHRWMAAFALVWAVSCTMVWLAAPAYLILLFLLFQLLVFPALMIGLCASACWHADLGPFRWGLPVVLAALYSIWPLNMLFASRPAPPNLSFVLYGLAVSLLGMAAGTIARKIRDRNNTADR